VNDGFIAKQGAAFRVRDRSGVVEQHAVRLTGVDVQCARLLRMSQHLHHAREVVVRQVAAETCVGLGEHLRGLKALCFTDDELLHVGGNDRRLPVPVDVIVAAGLKCVHQRALASIAKRDYGQIGVL